jgi:hypothetical protein
VGKTIPADLYDYLSNNPKTSGKALFKLGLTSSERTGRRHKGWFKEGAIRDENYYINKKPAIASVQEKQKEIDIDEFFRLAPQLVALKDKLDPIYTQDEFDFKTDKPIAVIFPSCMHLGGRYTVYEELQRIFQQVLDIPGIYWGSLGDDIEGMLPSFVDATSMTEQIITVPDQYVVLSSILGKLVERNKLLFGIGSQHGSDWSRRRHGSNPVKKIYLGYDVPFYDGKAYLHFKVGQETYHVAVAHSFQGSSQWNPLQAQSKAFHFDFPNADVVVMGDKHNFDVMETRASNWEMEAGNRKSDRILLLQSGTAKTGPDVYTIQGWSKGRLGWPIVVFYPNEHLVKYSWDLADVEYWLNG